MCCKCKHDHIFGLASTLDLDHSNPNRLCSTAVLASSKASTSARVKDHIKQWVGAQFKKQKRKLSAEDKQSLDANADILPTMTAGDTLSDKNNRQKQAGESTTEKSPTPYDLAKPTLFPSVLAVALFSTTTLQHLPRARRIRPEID